MSDKKWDEQNAVEKSSTIIWAIILVAIAGFAIAVIGSCILNPPNEYRGYEYEPEIGGRYQ